MISLVDRKGLAGTFKMLNIWMRMKQMKSFYDTINPEAF